VVCGNAFTPATRTPRAPLYCSPACSMVAFRARQNRPVANSGKGC
jgi:hypothetical protein